MLTGHDPYARSEAARLVIAVGTDDEATVEQIGQAAAERGPDGYLCLLLATAGLTYEGAVGMAGDRWAEPLNLVAWAATPDESGELNQGADG